MKKSLVIHIILLIIPSLLVAASPSAEERKAAVELAAQNILEQKAEAAQKSFTTLLSDIASSGSNLNNMRRSILDNPLVKAETEKIKNRKNPYADESGVFIISPDDVNSFLDRELKNTEDKSYKNTLRERKHSVSEYNDKSRDYDRLTNDPRYLKLVRQDRENYINLVNPETGDVIDTTLIDFRDKKPESYQRLMNEYGTEQDLKKALYNEFHDQEGFEKSRLSLEKDLSKHGVAEAEMLAAKGRFNREIRDEANEQDMAQSLEHRKIHALADALDNAERAMRDAQAQVAVGGDVYVKDNYSKLRKEFDIDKMYEDSMNRYKQEHPKQFDKFYQPSLDTDSTKTMLQMKSQAEKASKSVRDLKNSWLSPIWFYNVSFPYYHAKYYGHKLKNALGLNSKIAQDVSDLASKAKSKLYGVIPSVSVSFHKDEDRIKLMQERDKRDLQIKKEIQFIDSIRLKQNQTEDDLKALRNIEYDLSKPFTVRYEVHKLRESLNDPLLNEI